MSNIFKLVLNRRTKICQSFGVWLVTEFSARRTYQSSGGMLGVPTAALGY
jgi:hypothetical protein